MSKKLLLAVQEQITSGPVTKENMDFLMGVVKTEAKVLDIYLGFGIYERYVDYVYGSYKRKKLSALKKVVAYLLDSIDNLEKIEAESEQKRQEVESTTDDDFNSRNNL